MNVKTAACTLAWLLSAAAAVALRAASGRWLMSHAVCEGCRQGLKTASPTCVQKAYNKGCLQGVIGPAFSSVLCWLHALITNQSAGSPLDLAGNMASVPLATQPITMSLVTVESAAAENATGNLWNARVGLPDDGLPEVPPGGGSWGKVWVLYCVRSSGARQHHGHLSCLLLPRHSSQLRDLNCVIWQILLLLSHHPHFSHYPAPAANITLAFSYPVDLSMLAAALKLLPANESDTAAITSKIAVLPCPEFDITPMPRIMPLANTGERLQSASKPTCPSSNP